MEKEGEEEFVSILVGVHFNYPIPRVEYKVHITTTIGELKERLARETGRSLKEISLFDEKNHFLPDEILVESYRKDYFMENSSQGRFLQVQYRSPQLELYVKSTNSSAFPVNWTISEKSPHKILKEIIDRVRTADEEGTITSLVTKTNTLPIAVTLPRRIFNELRELKKISFPAGVLMTIDETTPNSPILRLNIDSNYLPRKFYSGKFLRLVTELELNSSSKSHRLPRLPREIWLLVKGFLVTNEEETELIVHFPLSYPYTAYTVTITKGLLFGLRALQETTWFDPTDWALSFTAKDLFLQINRFLSSQLPS